MANILLAAQAFAQRHAGFDARRQAETLVDVLEELALDRR
jgi:hypothetical protein